MIGISNPVSLPINPVSIPLIFGQSLSPLLKVKSLGVFLGQDLSLSPQIAEVIRKPNYALFTLRKVLPFLPNRGRAIAVGALVNSHMDYANALYTGLLLKDLNLLQRTQNQAVRLATGLKWGSSVSLQEGTFTGSRSKRGFHSKSSA